MIVYTSPSPNSKSQWSPNSQTQPPAHSSLPSCTCIIIPKPPAPLKAILQICSPPSTLARKLESKNFVTQASVICRWKGLQQWIQKIVG